MTTLPPASAPQVSIRAVPQGAADTTSRLGLNISGGTFDIITYAWRASAGTLAGAGSIAPRWTRPDSDQDVTIECTIGVFGIGIKARATTSDTVDADPVTAVVGAGGSMLPVAAAPSVSIDAVAAGDEGTSVALSATIAGGTYDTIAYAWTVSGGTLDDDTLAAPTWTRPAVEANTDYSINLTVTVGGNGSVARNGTRATRAAAAVDTTVRNVAAVLPVADAPSVSIDAIAAGDEETSVALSATISGGTYDALAYRWTVAGGTLDDATLAAPTWTRPAVSGNRDLLIRLTVTASGTGTVARSGTQDAATAQRTARVQDAGGQDPPAIPVTPPVPAEPAGEPSRGGSTPYEVQVRNLLSLDLVSIQRDFLSAKWTRRAQQGGEFEIVTHDPPPLGSVIAVVGGPSRSLEFAGVVEIREFNAAEYRQLGDVRRWTVSGRDLLSFFGGSRVVGRAAPEPRQGDAETVIKAYWASNLIGAPIAARDIRGMLECPFTIADDQQRGETISAAGARRSLLMVTSDAAKAGNVLPVVTLNASLDGYVLDVAVPRNRGYEFSAVLENVDELTYRESTQSLVNAVTVLGEGSGSTRTTREVLGTAIDGIAALRQEAMHDARDSNNLQAAGEAFLARSRAAVRSAEATPRGGYRTHWDVGDLVQLVIPGLVSEQRMVVSASVELEKGAAHAGLAAAGTAAGTPVGSAPLAALPGTVTAAVGAEPPSLYTAIAEMTCEAMPSQYG